MTIIFVARAKEYFSFLVDMLPALCIGFSEFCAVLAEGVEGECIHEGVMSKPKKPHSSSRCGAAELGPFCPSEAYRLSLYNSCLAYRI